MEEFILCLIDFCDYSDLWHISQVSQAMRAASSVTLMREEKKLLALEMEELDAIFPEEHLNRIDIALVDVGVPAFETAFRLMRMVNVHVRIIAAATPVFNASKARWTDPKISARIVGVWMNRLSQRRLHCAAILVGLHVSSNPRHEIPRAHLEERFFSRFANFLTELLCCHASHKFHLYPWLAPIDDEAESTDSAEE